MDKLEMILDLILIVAGTIAGIYLVFFGYSQYLSYLIKFFKEPAAIKALGFCFWLAFSNIHLDLLSKVINED